MLRRLWRKWGRKGRRREVGPKRQRVERCGKRGGGRGGGGGYLKAEICSQCKGIGRVRLHWPMPSWTKVRIPSQVRSGTRGVNQPHASVMCLGSRELAQRLCVQVKEEGNCQVWAQGHQDSAFESRLKVRKSNFLKIASARALLECIIRSPRVCTLRAIGRPHKLHRWFRGSQD